ncbi:MAG: hypothetical protein ACYTGZ_04685 [Planctomycetota bacterium]
MAHRKFLSLYLLVVVAAFGIAQATEGEKPKQSDTWDGSVPKVILIGFVKADDAGSAKLEKTIAGLRRLYEDKDVLFVRVDATSRGSRHQAKLLLNSLSVARDLWSAGFKSPGTVVLVDPDIGESVAKFDHKKDSAAIKKALDKALTPDQDEREKDMDDEGDDDEKDDDEKVPEDDPEDDVEPPQR